MTCHARRRPPVTVAAAAIAILVALTVACSDDDESGDDAGTTEAGEAAAPTGDAGGTAATTGATDPTVETDPSDSPATTASATTGGSPAGGGDYTSAIQAYLQSPTGGALTAEQSACAAPAWLDIITVERLEESDQTPESIEGGLLDTVKVELEEDEAQELIRALTDCGVDLRELFLAGVGDAPEAECINQELSDETIEQLLREALLSTEPSEALSDEIDRVREACGISD
jgi:hypothetical protein